MSGALFPRSDSRGPGRDPIECRAGTPRELIEVPVHGVNAGRYCLAFPAGFMTSAARSASPPPVVALYSR